MARPHKYTSLASGSKATRRALSAFEGWDTRKAKKLARPAVRRTTRKR